MPITSNAFKPGATVTVAAASGTTGANRQQLSGAGSVVEINNVGGVEVFVKLGGATVAAALTDYPVPGGQCKTIGRDPNGETYVDAITASGTANVRFTVGEGQ